MSEKFYKVLPPSGCSANGGKHRWSLPTKNADGSWTPGEWHEIPASVRIVTCRTGFHLTVKPSAWWKPGWRVFLAEPDGDRGVAIEDKTAFRRVRLTREITDRDVANDLGTTILRGSVPAEILWDGSGDGYGYGYGYGSGYGDGDGYGYGYGYGSGDGYGYGYGYGYGPDVVQS